MRRNVAMNKKMFQSQFVDYLAGFMYIDLKDKVKTKSNIKKSIFSFEDIWIDMLREGKKNDKRKS